MLGGQGKRPFHMVAAENPSTNDVTIITVYYPDPRKWDKEFKRRRS